MADIDRITRLLDARTLQRTAIQDRVMRAVLELVSSFDAWFRAFATSWRSILLTTSNDESAIFCCTPMRLTCGFARPPRGRCSLFSAALAGGARHVARAANGSGL